MSDTDSAEPAIEDVHLGALDRMGAIVDAATESNLMNPTPCDEWNVRQVIEHTVGLNFGFAQALSDGAADEDAYRPRPIEHWQASVAAVRDALESRADEDSPIRVVPVSDELTFSTREVVAIHLLDVVVHAWDVAKGLGLHYVPAEEATAAISDMAVLIATVPLPSTREQFAPTLGAPDDEQTWLKILRLLGREPHWSTVDAHPSR